MNKSAIIATLSAATFSAIVNYLFYRYGFYRGRKSTEPKPWQPTKVMK